MFFVGVFSRINSKNNKAIRKLNEKKNSGSMDVCKFTMCCFKVYYGFECGWVTYKSRSDGSLVWKFPSVWKYELHNIFLKKYILYIVKVFLSSVLKKNECVYKYIYYLDKCWWLWTNANQSMYFWCCCSKKLSFFFIHVVKRLFTNYFEV